MPMPLAVELFSGVSATRLSDIVIISKGNCQCSLTWTING
jgi:hypothetical protein